MQRILILFFFHLLLISSLIYATNYYVSNSGYDNNPGTSPGLAWRTTARVNANNFQPGDRVLLAGGQDFTGGIWLRDDSRGTATQPIVVSSYGTGRATIRSGDSYGFYAHNTAGIELRALNFVGSGRLTNRNSGIIFYLDSANAHLQHLRLDSLDVRITNCQVHANGEAGLSSYSLFPAKGGYAHHNWYVGNCTAFDNAGRADVTTTHTGNGIALSGIDGAVVEKSTAYHNGWLNANPSGGPVGIWGWCCNNLVIQHRESHHNQSGTALDGGGFRLGSPGRGAEHGRAGLRNRSVVPGIPHGGARGHPRGAGAAVYSAHVSPAV